MDSDRRTFCKTAAAIVAGGVAAAVPIGAGMSALLNPLRPGSKDAHDFVRVAALDAVPNDNVPRKFSVVADQVDAWNKTPAVPIGAVYLRRSPTNVVEALNAICPHAGGFIDYLPAEACFLCPLHKSLFNSDGSIKDRSSPAPRAMDTLPAEVRDGAIWVKFENFRAGVAQKIPA
ncbi:MAG TPA: Rieske (2Fe-2S) protein [Verrucomicrobiae bacterium]|jgi:menaquinol-cytochrome c reductase iron-sulfur subunit|nr:Rieske (2Fe-2S) protein [Verrucomicrobiae bacterium]